MSATVCVGLRLIYQKFYRKSRCAIICYPNFAQNPIVAAGEGEPFSSEALIPNKGFS